MAVNVDNPRTMTPTEHRAWMRMTPEQRAASVRIAELAPIIRAYEDEDWNDTLTPVGRLDWQECRTERAELFKLLGA